jgi:prevent-host-death family protein
MATDYSAFDAKNRLGHLLDRAEAGEIIVITRRGKPVAKLSAYTSGEVADGEALVKVFQRIRASIKKSGMKIKRSEVRSWINEGRR